MSKVRYLTISRVSLEIVEKLTPEENARFNKIIFSCFRQLEDGQEMTYQETESPFLNMALREAAAELETGYRNYVQKVNARKKAPTDQPPIDQRSTADQPPIDNRREEKREEEKRTEESGREGMQGGRPFSDIEQYQLNAALASAGISPDPAFWSLAQAAGLRITDNAIRKAREENSRSLKYVVKLIREAWKGD